jgi:hypothetical protein
MKRGEKMIEKLGYRVIIKDGNYEVRFYEDFNIARIAKKRRGNFNDGLDDIFNYIGGANEKNKKITRTSPVLTAVTGESIITSFIMPKRYDLRELPKPNDAQINIQRIKGGYFAVVRFSGVWTEPKFNRSLRNLKNWIDTRIWDPLSDEMIARYYAPFTPWYMKRNEILIRVIMKEEI